MKFALFLLSLLSVVQNAQAGTHLSCTVTEAIHGANTGLGLFVYPEIGSTTRFDPNQNFLTVLTFSNHAFLPLEAAQVSPDENGGWQYFWNNETKEAVTRVIYSTNGKLLIQIFRNFSNQQLGFSEYRLNCEL